MNELEQDKLKERISELERQYQEARALAIGYQEAAARLMEAVPVRICRKVLKQTAGRDLFADLRPAVSQEAGRLEYHIDSAAVRNEKLVIRGWVYDACGIHPEVMLREKSRILTPEVLWYPRQDINDLYLCPDWYQAGFTVRLPFSEVKGDQLLLEFETERGVLTHPINVDRGALNPIEEPVLASDSAGYDDWIRDHLVTEEQLQEERKMTFSYMPLISICIPLYRTDPVFLRELMDSLLGQSYQNIEICLADGSEDDKVEQLIRQEYERDPRVRYCHLTENRGISENTNAAFSMAQGEFIMLADHDDVVEKDACFEIVKCLNEDHEIDAVYTDEDKLMLTGGVYYSPNLKPDFNLDLLRTNNYITHIFCVRRSLLEQIGGEHSEYDGAQDYDLILRAVELARKVGHVPKVLYHWRAHPASTAGNPESKLYAYENGRRAIEAHYERTGVPAVVRQAEEIGSYRSEYQIDGEPLISIVIPNKDHKEVLERALRSIFEKSTWKRYEIIIAENHSTTPEIFAYYRELEASEHEVRIITYDEEFNYSAINNAAAACAKGDYLLFLNNDVEVITDRWMEELLGYCQRRDVGAVGARLYYPDDRLQHCGLVVGIGGTAGHILQYTKRNSGGYFGRVVKSQDVSAVTAACMMTRRDVFEAVGGFDETLAVAYNDVDYCLKVRNAGLLVVYDAWAELYHYESLSRGSDDASADQSKHERQVREGRHLREKWPVYFASGDPYFNPNLDYNSSEYVLSGTVPEADRNHDYE